MKLYHRTARVNAEAIRTTGFIDGRGRYMTDTEFEGVWLSDRPLDENEGACGDTLLSVDIDLPEPALVEYEWIEDGKAYREFLIPAALLNAHARVEIIEE